MKKKSKRFQACLDSYDGTKQYGLKEAIGVLKGFTATKFDEALELNFQLGIRPEQSNEMVRGTTSLPHGSGKKVRVLCFVKGEAQKAAEAAGADYVGGEEYVKKISENWLEFDAVVAHPDMMRDISKLGRVLGPRGLMPTPKTGTVTTDVARTIKEIKQGRVEFKSDKTGGMHVLFGKKSFSETHLFENAKALMKAVIDAKPSSSKGDYLKAVTLSASHSPGVRLKSTSMSFAE